MSLSIFDDDDLVESLGYSRDYHVSHHETFRTFDRHADSDRCARWYERTMRIPALAERYRARKVAEYHARRGTQPRQPHVCVTCGVLVRVGGVPVRYCDTCRLDADAKRKREARIARLGRQPRQYTARTDSRRWVTARREAA